MGNGLRFAEIEIKSADFSQRENVFPCLQSLQTINWPVDAKGVGEADRRYIYYGCQCNLLNDNWRAWYHLGLMYYANGQIEKSSKAWLKSIDKEDNI